MGSMTGRGAGYCAGTGAPGFANGAPGRGLGRGVGAAGRNAGYGRRYGGFGPGRGRGFGGFTGGGVQANPAADTLNLKQQARELKSRLRTIEQQLAAMGTEPDES
ncbi:hypothetical protein JCM14469_12800 [Desulfatiferula olefinivorans]